MQHPRIDFSGVSVSRYPSFLTTIYLFSIYFVSSISAFEMPSNLSKLYQCFRAEDLANDTSLYIRPHTFSVPTLIIFSEEEADFHGSYRSDKEVTD